MALVAGREDMALVHEQLEGRADRRCIPVHGLGDVLDVHAVVAVWLAQNIMDDALLECW